MIKNIKTIINHYKARNNIFLFISWIILRFKKYFKVQFKNKNCGNGDIDVVIPTILKDFDTLSLLLESLRYLQQTVNNIYIIAPKSQKIINFCKNKNIIFIDELDVLGFGKNKIKYTVDGLDRSGWMFQQLLKLSGENFTHLKDYLVIDSDTVFVNKNCFMNSNKYIFFASDEWHQPYFESFKNIFGYKAPTVLSLTSHMMIFNHDKLRKMKKELENKHNKIWYDVYMSTISLDEQSCISDYDTYGNWMLYNYPNEIEITPFYNKSISRKNINDLNTLSKNFHNLKSISFHSHIDKESI